MSLKTDIANNLLNQIYKNIDFTNKPSELWLGLIFNSAEIRANGYSRVKLDPNNFSNPNNGIIKNINPIIFPTASNIWSSSNTTSNTMQIGVSGSNIWQESKIRMQDLGTSDQVGSNTRFPPLIVKSDESVAVGFTKYIRKVDIARTAFRGLIPAADSDQAWSSLALFSRQR